MYKQIEEMASCLIGNAVTGADSTKVLRIGYLTAKEIAYILVEVGYRKIPECAVVLTPAERDEEMRFIREDVIERMEATRKETAEKFAERAKTIADLKLKLYGVRFLDMDDIDEICKELEGENV